MQSAAQKQRRQSRGTTRCGLKLGDHYPKAVEPAPEVRRVPVAGSKARAPLNVFEGAPAQHPVILNLQTLTSILSIIGIALEDAIGLLPYISSHVGAAVRAISLWAVPSYRCGIAYIQIKIAARLVRWLVTPRLYTPVRGAGGFLPCGFAEQAHHPPTRLAGPLAERHSVVPGDKDHGMLLFSLRNDPLPPMVWRLVASRLDKGQGLGIGHWGFTDQVLFQNHFLLGRFVIHRPIYLFSCRCPPRIHQPGCAPVPG